MIYPEEHLACFIWYRSNILGHNEPSEVLLEELYFHLTDLHHHTGFDMRPTKIPLFARSMMMMEPKIIFRDLNVPVLIFDPVSEQDPMPFEKENQELKNQHPNYIDYIVYKGTEHNIHYEHPERFTNDVITFMNKSLLPK